MTFAALQSTLNTACASALANASATWGGASVPVIFHAEDQTAGAGQVVGGKARVYVAEAPVADWGTPSPVRGDDLAIDGVDYTVGQVDLDPTGWLKLYVRVA